MTDQDTDRKRGEVAEAARVIAGAGLAEAFGHVSMRIGDGFLITATRPMGAATADDVHAIGRKGNAPEGAEDVPLETPMHRAIYGARSDVGAICRTHSPAAVRAGVRAEVPPLVHGLGGLAGEVAVCDRLDLVTDEASGDEVAAALADADCLLIRGNGSLSTGRNLAEAAVRARYLEERCLTGEGMSQAETIGAEDLVSRSKWFEKEMARSWAWMRWRYVGDS